MCSHARDANSRPLDVVLLVGEEVVKEQNLHDPVAVYPVGAGVVQASAELLLDLLLLGVGVNIHEHGANNPRHGPSKASDHRPRSPREGVRGPCHRRPRRRAGSYPANDRSARRQDLVRELIERHLLVKLGHARAENVPAVDQVAHDKVPREVDVVHPLLVAAVVGRRLLQVGLVEVEPLEPPLEETQGVTDPLGGVVDGRAGEDGRLERRQGGDVVHSLLSLVFHVPHGIQTVLLRGRRVRHGGASRGFAVIVVGWTRTGFFGVLARRSRRLGLRRGRRARACHGGTSRKGGGVIGWGFRRVGVSMRRGRRLGTGRRRRLVS